MTGSILTPFTIVAIVVVLGCLLAALYFLARRRAPSTKPAPRDSRGPVPRDAPLPRVAPRPAARSAPDDGPGRTVLMKPEARPDIPPAMRVPGAGAGTPARDERRRGMDEIEHRRRAANTRLKGERPRQPAASDDNASTEERVITAGSAAPPPPPQSPPTILLPREDDEPIESGQASKATPAPAAARPQQPATKPVEDDEVTTPRHIDPASEGGKTIILGTASPQASGPMASPPPRSNDTSAPSTEHRESEEHQPVPEPDADVDGIGPITRTEGPPPGAAYSVALGPDGRPVSHGNAKTGSLAPPRYDPPEPSLTPKPEPTPEVLLDDAQSALDIVDCSVFAPPRVAAGERIKVQAHLHLAEQFAKVRRAAAEIDRRANLQGAKSLLHPLARGVEVELYLACPGLIVDAPLQRVKWEGTPTHVLFNVEAPAGLAPEPINAAVYLSIDGIPVGDVSFRLYVASVQPADSEDAAVPVPADLATATAAKTRGTSYSCAFVSYARKDFDRVSLFAQGLAQRDMELAFDVASLEPGADWGTKLPELIGRCDVFYLMWSDNAAQSKWVEKEARLAVWLHHKSQRGAPRIVPITLHRPAPKPPGFLGPFHFDSPWLAHRTAQAMPLFKEAPPQ